MSLFAFIGHSLALRVRCLLQCSTAYNDECMQLYASEVMTYTTPDLHLASSCLGAAVWATFIDRCAIGSMVFISPGLHVDEWMAKRRMLPSGIG